jgi:DMSO/TMAO reductase YedYZ molybdopterin-dependent catalytic subunit
MGYDYAKGRVRPLDAKRRNLLRMTGLLAGAGLLASEAASAFAAGMVELPFANGERRMAKFPQKGEMILQRTRPALLETPMHVYDNRVFTPNDEFFVRWHLADIPQSVNVDSFRLRVHGAVNSPLELTLKQLINDFEPVQVAAVCQCSGNSRGFFAPRVAGGEWGNGAMGNAMWTGVRLKDVLAKAGLGAGAVQVRFNGVDKGVEPKTPDFMKSLAVDHANDGEVMIAYAMNGQQLPLLNGFPLRLVVPGWYATYWVKMLDDIEVLTQPDDNFWMKTAYLIPDTPGADMKPGEAGLKMVPINKMNTRSFITNLHTGSTVHVKHSTLARGIAFGGDAGVAKVMFSADGGATWQDAKLGPDHGKYSFRGWEAHFTPAKKGELALMVKAVNTDGQGQSDQPNWNPAGFMRNVIERVSVRAV